MAVAARISHLVDYHKPQLVCIDEGNMGAGVVDRLRALRYPVVGVQFGAKPDESAGYDGSEAYANRRAQMYGRLRRWLAGGVIDDDVELRNDLTSIQYGFRNLGGRDCLQLESKDDMRRRGLPSTDDGDALALCFAQDVRPKVDDFRYRSSRGNPGRGDEYASYDPIWGNR
jgi:hypothetical protein